jgi:Domain of unknown function (DUF1707)
MVPVPYSRDIELRYERGLMHRELREYYARNGMDRPSDGRYPIASLSDVSVAMRNLHDHQDYLQQQIEIQRRQMIAMAQVPSMIMSSTAVTAGELAEIQAVLDQYYPGSAATYQQRSTDMSRHPQKCPCGTCLPRANTHVHCRAAGCAPEKAELPGVHLLEKKRVGRETRDIYLEQLRRAYSEEYIDPAEMDARQDAMMSATTEDELKLLVRDLEPLKEDKPVLTGKLPRQAVLYFILTIISVCFPIMAAIGILAGGNVIAVSVLALIGGFAAIGTQACVSDA